MDLITKKHSIFTLARFLLLVLLMQNTIQAGATDIIKNGVKYQLDSKYGTATVVANNYSGNISIASTIYDNSNKSYSVDYVSSGAFVNCDKLTSISWWPKYLKTSITPEFFKGCTSLESINISQNGKYDYYSGLLYSIFTYVIFGNSIPEYRAGLCVCPPGKAGNINIPTSVGSYPVTNIKGAAFVGCKRIKSISLSSSVVSFEGGFEGCDSLTSFSVNYGNTAYYSSDGVLFQRSNNDLVAFPTAKNSDYYVPLTTKKILTKAFAYCKSNKIIVNESVTSIASDAFKDAEVNLYLLCPPNNSVYSCLSQLSSNSVVYVHGKYLSEAKKYWTGEIHPIEDLWIGSSESYLGSVYFELVSTEEVDIVLSLTINSVRYEASSDNTYLIDGLNPNTTYDVNIAYVDKDGVIISQLDSIQTSNPTLNATCVLKETGALTFSVESSVDATLSPSEQGLYCRETETKYPCDDSGRSVVDNLIPGKNYTLAPYALYRDSLFYGSEQKIYTNNISMSINAHTTQTTITINKIVVNEDESSTAVSSGIRINGNDYEISSFPYSIEGLIPCSKYYIYPYAVYFGEKVYGSSYQVTMKGVNPTLSITKGVTDAIVLGSYTEGDATMSSQTITIKNVTYSADRVVLYGLDPNTSYTATFTVETKEGSKETITSTFTTANLMLKSLTPKNVRVGEAVVCAETNISDEETNVGFEWRKVDAPETVPSKQGTAIIYDGVMEGLIKNLQTTSYYNIRPYYQSAAGNMYYGEWIGIDPSDYSYFEPTVHTYASVAVADGAAVLTGYVMDGSDDIIERGFEYWVSGSDAKSRVKAEAPSDVQTVVASGQKMTATLNGLQSETTYTCRAYAKTSTETFYGEEVSFTTPVATGIEDMPINNEQLLSIHKVYDLQGRCVGTLLEGLPRGIYIQNGRKFWVK
ncbi:MAG: leucine-rich repeat domain-containing protein [Bacteroidaceae bacterium]|nr:leucine-rich repeat domain-containing protein [Bacteroidaceae bacterium]